MQHIQSLSGLNNSWGCAVEQRVRNQWPRAPLVGENASKTQRSCCFCFCCYQSGIPNRAVAVKSISVLSCLRKSREKIGIIVLCHFYSFHEDRSICLASISSVHSRYSAFGQHFALIPIQWVVLSCCVRKQFHEEHWFTPLSRVCRVGVILSYF